LTNSKEGRPRKGTWGGNGQGRERDYCTPDETANGTHGNACCECVEPGALCDKRKTTLETMVIEEGWYRHSPYTAQVLECEHEHACVGTMRAQEQVLNDKAEEGAAPMNTSVTGYSLCNHQYAGPLCSRCAPEHYRDGLTRECVSCDSARAAEQSASASKEVLPIVACIVLVVVLLVAVAVRSFGRIRDFWTRNEERIMIGSQHLTIMVVTFQLIANLQTAILFQGGAVYPEPFASVVRLSEVLTLDIFAVFRVRRNANRSPARAAPHRTAPRTSSSTRTSTLQPPHAWPTNRWTVW